MPMADPVCSVGRLSSLGFVPRVSSNVVIKRLSATSWTPRCALDVKIKMGDSKFQHELKAAVDVVERACRLCLSVKTSLNETGGMVEKNDATPVTVADFGVQALLVGEEDAGHLRKDLVEGMKTPETSKSPALVDLVTEEVARVASERVCSLTPEKVMAAIDRGGKKLNFTNRLKSSYWVLDPIDGTRGFLRGGHALYVVGLALVVDGQLVLGVMGCPNVSYVVNEGAVHGTPKLQMVSAQDFNKRPNGTHSADVQTGLLMASCTGCGCWVKPLSRRPVKSEEKLTMEDIFKDMLETKVDNCKVLKKARFCISDHEVWRSLPLAVALASASSSEDRVAEHEADILPLCCGSLCKYFAIAFGGASLFILHLNEGSSVKVWDHAAGVICVTEAGGQVTDVIGTPLQEMIGTGQVLFKPEGGVIATNGSLRDKVLQRFGPIKRRS
ncbi:hypothetical protein AXG93_4324s1390 [Marchantia polymorpha subsp. ruderalis]|uniref:3'(2'),5'-bisphosphate nucleotidase n=1 Tax=Marchantia polymorpha subsp. ruderalis TaxID=1480154 RepID=A0A176W1Q4_MARPO|nr:hypothetical protein AXG93_4324s1390 [Marchantia polymorpha subsp. ruderalis]